ncbi:MAG: homocysteine S-methyltransferase family protein [Proteobacteria bacterium]|nr:homocysteine S-methyltransferase family protein [Pseudomonadota bacterium]
MNRKKRIAGLLRKRVLILDGAMGTELQKRGMPAGVCPEAWCLANPGAVTQIHSAYRETGADCVYTATFGANRIKMGQYGLTNVRETNRTLAEVAVRTAGRGLVAGDIGPTGRFVEPFGDLPFEEAVALFKEQAQGLLEGGVDLFVIETMMDIQEARAALIAVREISDLFAIVTMTYEKHGRTLNGTDPVSALVTLQGLGADAVGCNCSSGPEAMLEMIAAMKPHARVPLVAKPNAGLPKLVGDATVFDLEAAGFGAFGGRFAAAGVNLMGGCCGTTPDHIRALRESLAAARPVAPVRSSSTAVSSARGALILERGKPLVTVGGRLNAADNETLRRELLAGEMATVRRAAREQEKEGAALLLVQAAAPGLDEKDVLGKIIGALSPTTRPPLLIDAGRIETVADALRSYPGRALVRVAAGRESMETLLPVAAKYGAAPVLGFPAEGEPAACRKAIREAIGEARRCGFTKDDIVVEIKIAAPVPQPEALATALGIISWCGERLGCRTLLDLTGAGKGLPEGKWLQASLLAAAQAAGVTLVVADPSAAELMHIRAAGELLLTAS